MLRMACEMSSVGSGRPFHGSTSCSQPSCFYFSQVRSRVAAGPRYAFSAIAALFRSPNAGREEDHLVRRSVRSTVSALLHASTQTPPCPSNISGTQMKFTRPFPCYVECTVYVLFPTQNVPSLQSGSPVSFSEPRGRTPLHIDTLGDCIDWNIPIPSPSNSRILVATCQLV